MTAVARMSPKWALRIGLVTVAFGGFAIWCVYDAKVSYPSFNQRASEYNRLLAAGLAETWPERAAQRGWPTAFRDDDRRPDGRITLKSAWDIGTQYVMMGGCLSVALVAGGRILRARRRTMRADDAGFLTIEGVLVPYADITDVDLKLWQRKSIARIHLRRSGRSVITLIDDWIYQGGEDVLAEIQRRTGLGSPGAAAVAPVTPDALPTAAVAAPEPNADARRDVTAR